jgi:hypothetical protein
MRLGFGLVGLLVTMAVIVIIMRMTDMNSAVLSANHSARNEASQISGHDANGEDARKSATLADTMKNNKLVSYQVTAVTPGGGYDSYFGLQVNDQIIGVINQGVEFDVGDTVMTADRDTVFDAYEKSGQLKVDRPGVGIITLPLPGTAGRGGLGLPGMTPPPTGAPVQSPGSAVPTH